MILLQNLPSFKNLKEPIFFPSQKYKDVGQQLLKSQNLEAQ